jgi:hypothetical protein
LGDPRCSRIHAIAEWLNDAWTLKDVSRNGTWVSERRIESNVPVPLVTGQILRFGSPDAEPWQVADNAAPTNLLVAETSGASTALLEDYTLVPEISNAHSLVHDTQRAAWMLYSTEEPFEIGGPYAHGDEVVVAGHRWRVFLANSHSPTAAPSRPACSVVPLHMVARLSCDEESTELTVIYGSESYDLGERAHHYLIAHLARLKAEHLHGGNDPLGAGWVEKHRLSKDLGLTSQHLNLQIHRAEKHIHDTLQLATPNAKGVFDKRRGRLRFGKASCEVYKGSQLIAQLQSI